MHDAVSHPAGGTEAEPNANSLGRGKQEQLNLCGMRRTGCDESSSWRNESGGTDRTQMSPTPTQSGKRNSRTTKRNGYRAPFLGRALAFGLLYTKVYHRLVRRAESVRSHLARGREGFVGKHSSHHSALGRGAEKTQEGLAKGCEEHPLLCTVGHPLLFGQRASSGHSDSNAAPPLPPDTGRWVCHVLACCGDSWAAERRASPRLHCVLLAVRVRRPRPVCCSSSGGVLWARYR
ncbi:hypothetical protein NDU88_008207 [Pleurodeles waltl]|uniref:Uncharacterized protein n=1 Tax=Pleurodeles waltl TaxID=8319 RepID=A0AAV7PRF7_PLEWA|nr:hypothetical protein NDU88_008207 [Pleurodeles waltl]